MIIELGTQRPVIDPTAWIAPTAVIAGDVTIGAGVSVWFGAVLRAEEAPISIGPDTSIQDGSVLHTDAGAPIVVGRAVTIGHNVTLHGCDVGDDAMVGMSAVVLNGARVGARSLVAAGALVTQGAEIPEQTLVAGVPGKVRRVLTADELAQQRANADNYCRLRDMYRAATRVLSD